MSSDEDGALLMAAFKKGGRPAASRQSVARLSASRESVGRQSVGRQSVGRQSVGTPSTRRQSTGRHSAKQDIFSPTAFFSEESSAAEDGATPLRSQQTSQRVAVAVQIPPTEDLEEFTYYEPKEEVKRVVREYQRRGELLYEVALANGKSQQVSFEDLLTLDGGPKALENFQDMASPSEDDDMSSSTAPETRPGLRAKPKKTRGDGMVDSTALEFSEDELAMPSRKGRQKQLTFKSDNRSGARSRRAIPLSDSSEDTEDEAPKRRRRRKAKVQEPIRRSGRMRAPVRDFDEDDEEDETDDSDIDILRSDVLPSGRGRKRKRAAADHGGTYLRKIPRTGMRQSDRTTRAQNNMQEADVNDIYRSESGSQPAAAPKVAVVREVFEALPRGNLFRSRHVEGCEVCSEGSTIAPLIYCQGCCMAYHKNCLGNRSTRDHLVTKVGDENFVLQCKRCINFYKRKDPTAPDLSKCQDCNRPGPACSPFRHRKTTMQEQKDRDDNGGQDPTVEMPSDLINNPANVLFRCTRCSRGYHYHHLPPLSQYSMSIERDEDETADERFQEYSRNWLCKECEDTKRDKVSGIIAWRPSDLETYQPGVTCYELSEDDKQYLIKWENQSYFRASWHSGAWTWGVTAHAMRKAFFKREDGPKMRTEDAIPEEYLRIDIVLDVKYTSYVEVRSEEIDKARIKEVDKALIKYKGLGYEDAVWEKVPTPEDGDRWLDFVTAYNDWVAGRYIRYPKQGPLKARVDKARGTTFAKLEKEKQPENLVGGELMKYQIEGLNWIYYQWYTQKNGILADEMGLGKTIQVIGFMATMVQDHNCFPFLVVVPNSTCANWRREIKQWAPSLRVVTFFGSSAARDMAYKYEMYPQGSKELRAHVVVTSYEAATDDSCRRIFRGVNWAGLIVDEGQRLKNDKSQLYGALSAVKSPFRLLLTGTPLQNNARELFNLLQFLDDTINAAELEEKYSEMTSENIGELHAQIRPFILRRTKAQVLTFLPPLGQIIVPLSMSTLQKKLYKSILAKNPELLKALFMTQKSLQKQERASLSNILMQLRKCLCHPFVYSREIEERTDISAVSHRNLVEASAKLQLLELLLSKLKERGHRVLIFSQFLDMLNIVEDFMDGMQMAYQRLDGTMGSLEKQKRIDQFNAPDSNLFAFLLSTRAGGVGINLATADTVIILDPDFNPHQDLQAISRAHRIGQKKKVLCFQMMTRASAEEKIVQMGRKKMALDHVVVEQLDAEDMEDKDVESILKHGAAELFKDDTDHDIRYDEASIEKLLDRSQIENTKTSDDTAESQFSFARVWANDQGALEDGLETSEEEVAPDPGVWDKILKERQAIAAAEALARAEALGRGKRARMNVMYNNEQDAAVDAADPIEASPVKKDKRKKKKTGGDSDTDFQDESDDSPSEAEAEAEAVPENLAELNPPGTKKASRSLYQNGAGASPKFPTNGGTTTPPGNPPSQPAFKRSNNIAPIPSRHPSAVVNAPVVKPFCRAHLPTPSPLEPQYGHRSIMCSACHRQHPRGACPLKVAGVEHCNLCGLAHFGQSRTCPHIRSETQVRAMLEALKNSPEKKELVNEALKYLRGVKGHLVQAKKKEKEKAEREKAMGTQPGFQPRQYQAPPSQSQAQPYQGGLAQPPQREMPKSSSYTPSHQVQPGSVGSHLSNANTQHARGPAPAQRQVHRPSGQPLSNLPDQEDFDEHAVESALRGFLGGT